MNMIQCRICGSEFNQHVMDECPFLEERHRVRRCYDHATGVSGLKIFAVSPDDAEELRERRSFLDEGVLVQWFEGGREIHEHLEPFPEY